MTDSPRKADAIRRVIAATPDEFYLRTEPLTREQINQLPDGADVLILWSGGNGPHRYRVKKCGEFVYAGIVSMWGNDAWWNRPVDFTGAEPPFTMVWRIYPLDVAQAIARAAISLTQPGGWHKPPSEPSPKVAEAIAAHLMGDED